jgi:ABC-2 type transport system ATP-binding protein
LPEGELVIETRNLTKRFGGVLALDNLNLEVPPAAIGLLGPNGAGKTTLIRLLLGLSRPTSGSASLLGMDTRADSIRIRERVGYMPESDVLPSNATAADFVGHMAEMSGIPKVHARQRAADVLYQVGLDEERYRLIKGFSTGMKQRVKLAQAVVHDPSLVFLDEPTAGMDPPGRDAMLELIVRVYRMMRMTVVLSSHILEDIERVCDYVIIINGGKLVLSRPIGKTAVDSHEIVVRFSGDARQFIDRLATYGVHEVRLATKGLITPFPELIVRHGNDAVYDAIRDTADDLKAPLRSLRSRAHSLEEVYLEAVGAGAVEAIESEGHPIDD